MYDVFFFFQAEDGIRDTSVTGVQTCALPISRVQTTIGIADEGITYMLSGGDAARRVPPAVLGAKAGSLVNIGGRQIGKRRVGKECRAGWAACDVKENVNSVQDTVQDKEQQNA